MIKSKLNQFHIRLLLVQGLLIIITLMLFTIIVTVKLSSELKLDALERIQMERTGLQNQVELNLGRVEAVIGQLTNGDVFKQLTSDEFDARAQFAIKETPLITQIYIMDTKGIQIYKSSYLETRGDRSDRDYFKAAMKGESYFSSVIISRSTNIPITVYARPIYANGKICGVIGASIDLAFLSKLLAPVEAVYNPDASYGFIVDCTGKVIGHPNQTYVAQMMDLSYLEPVKLALSGKSGTGEYQFDGRDKLAAYSFMNKSKWGIFVQTPKRVAFQHVLMIQQVLVFTFLAIASISVLMAFGVSKYFNKPLTEVLTLIKNFEKDRVYPMQCSLRNDEFGTIGDAFIGMAETVVTDQLELENRVLERTRVLTETMETLLETQTELEISNHELEATLRELNAVQEKIVQSEKMAALGRMTNNFAHEVNTPLGTAITVVDFLELTIRSLIDHLQKDVHSAQELTEHLDDLSEMTQLIKRQLDTINGLFDSLNKSDFISSRFSETKDDNLAKYLSMQVVDLQAQLKDTMHQLEFSCDFSEEVDIPYKEKLVQVMKLLLQNSVQHGFEAGVIGNIKIVLKNEGDIVKLSYSDNGKNLSDAQLNRIFEPYYKGDMTTGGKGLGLTIVYSLIVDFMNGKIACHNLSPSGLEYIIEIPCTNNLTKGGVTL